MSAYTTFHLELLVHKPAQLGVLTRSRRCLHLIIIAASRKAQILKQLIQRKLCLQGTDQNRFLSVGETLQIDAQIFFYKFGRSLPDRGLHLVESDLGLKLGYLRLQGLHVIRKAFVSHVVYHALCLLS